MNYYSQSASILKTIQNAKHVLINCHTVPDPDSVGSSTAVRMVLESMGKRVSHICPNSVPKAWRFLNYATEVKETDFSTFDFSPYDLFLVLDSSSYDRVTGSKRIRLPDNLDTVIIDHHLTNYFKHEHGKGLQNRILVDTEASATAEIVYRLFQEWNVKISKDVATALYAGIVGDTVFFKYMKNPDVTFSIARDLISKGADHDLIVLKMTDSYDFAFIQLLGVYLSRMKIEKQKEKSFVWSVIPYEEYEKFGKPEGVKETAADSFFRSIKDVDFGIAMLEKEKGKLSVSFRSKPHFDVSNLAEKLGGGGHKNAAGCTIEGKLDEILQKVLKVVRE